MTDHRSRALELTEGMEAWHEDHGEPMEWVTVALVHAVLDVAQAIRESGDRILGDAG